VRGKRRWTMKKQAEPRRRKHRYSENVRGQQQITFDDTVQEELAEFGTLGDERDDEDDYRWVI
jgi:hypothetical protein